MFEYHLNNIKDKLKQLGLQVVDFDLNRPWGAFFCINELQAQLFSDYFFDEIDINNLKTSLMVEKNGGKQFPVIPKSYRLQYRVRIDRILKKIIARVKRKNLQILIKELIFK